MCTENCNACTVGVKNRKTSTSCSHRFVGTTLPLPYEEHVLLEEAMNKGKVPNPVSSLNSTLDHLQTAQKAFQQFLPAHICRKLLAMRLGVVTPTYLLIKGFPIDNDLPPTPIDGSWKNDKVTYISEAVLFGLAMMLGIPFGFVLEKDGRLLNQITPVPGKENSQSSASATNTLGYHTEIAYHDGLRPRFLILVCIRQDKEKQAATNIVDMRRVISNLPEWAVDELRKHQFMFKIPDSFSNSSEWAAPKPILSGSLDNPEVIFDAKACKVIYDRKMGVYALALLEEEMNKPQYNVAIKLEPGDALIIPNYYVVHGRSYFEPNWDGLDRWLIRTYIVDGIFKSLPDMATDKLLVFNK
jgi:L-asparagine oxygenase